MDRLIETNTARTTISFDVVYQPDGKILITIPKVDKEGIPFSLYVAISGQLAEVQKQYNQANESSTAPP